MQNLNGHSTEVESGISALRNGVSKKEKMEKENWPIEVNLNKSKVESRKSSPGSDVIISDESNSSSPVENGNGGDEITDESTKKTEEVKLQQKSDEKLKSELEAANKELIEELKSEREKLKLMTLERDNYQNLYRTLSEKFDEKVEQFRNAKDYRPAAKYDEIISKRIAKFAERAAKGKTEVKEYQEALKNIQVIASNQKTIYEKLTLWVNENESLTKQIGGLGENAERFNLLRKKTFSNKGSNTILMDETPLHYKRFSVGSHHTPTPFKNISPKNSSNSSASGIHQPVAPFTHLSKSADSVSTARGVSNLPTARCSKIQSSPTIPSEDPVPHQSASKRPNLPSSAHQQVPYQVVNGMPLNLNNYNCMSISLPKDAKVIQSCQIINGQIVKTGTTQLGSSSATNSPLVNSIAAKSVSTNSPSSQLSPQQNSPKFSTPPPEQVNLKRSPPPPSKKRKSEEASRASIDLTSDDEEQPKKKAMMSSSPQSQIQTTFINAPRLVIANAVPVNLVPANPVREKLPESPPRRNLPRMLDSDIPECNKVTLNDGAVRILPPLPAPPKFKMPKMMPSDLKQLPHTLQLEANFSGDNKMITMWDNIKNSTNEKKNRAEAKTYELFVCTIPDEEEKNEDGDPKPLKWKRIGGKDVPGHRIPVKCSLKNFPRKGNYIFIVRGKDCYGRVGSFSEFAVAKTPSGESSSETKEQPKEAPSSSAQLSDTPTSSVTKSTTIL